MSRRYGRNQKRKAREQIAELQHESNRWHDAYYLNVPMLESELRKNRDALASITDVLGPNFVGLPAKELAMQVEARFRLFTDCGPEHMHLVEIAMRTANNEHPQKQIHCRVRLANGESAYSLSESALDKLTEDQLVSLIAPEIARHLVREVRKNPPFNRR